MAVRDSERLEIEVVNERPLPVSEFLEPSDQQVPDVRADSRTPRPGNLVLTRSVHPPQVRPTLEDAKPPVDLRQVALSDRREDPAPQVVELLVLNHAERTNRVGPPPLEGSVEGVLRPGPVGVPDLGGDLIVSQARFLEVDDPSVAFGDLGC